MRLLRFVLLYVLCAGFWTPLCRFAEYMLLHAWVLRFAVCVRMYCACRYVCFKIAMLSVLEFARICVRRCFDW